MNKSADAFRTISEVSDELDVPKHVLRFWEARFPQIKPMKRGGGRRYYRPEDVELLKGIQHLLHAEGYTIRGVQKILRQQGVDEVKGSIARAVDGSPRGSDTRPATALMVRSGARGRSAKRSQPASRADPPAALAAIIAELEALRGLLRGDEMLSSAGRQRASVARRTR